MHSHVFAIAYVLLYAALNAAGVLMLRVALADSDGLGVGAALSWRLFLGLFFYGLGFVAWMIALRRYPIGAVYPIFVGVGYATVILMAIALLHEAVSPLRLFGTALVGVGVVLMSVSS